MWQVRHDLRDNSALWKQSEWLSSWDAQSLGGETMLRTIAIGEHVSVQGLLVGNTADGRVMIKVGDKVFTGFPVNTVRAA